MSDTNDTQVEDEVTPTEGQNLDEQYIDEFTVHFRSAVPALVVKNCKDRKRLIKCTKVAAERLGATVVFWDADEGLHYFPNNGVNGKQLGANPTEHPVEALKVIQEMIIEQKVPQDAPTLGSKTIFMMRNFGMCWAGMDWGPGRPAKVRAQIENLLGYFKNRTCSFLFYGPNIDLHASFEPNDITELTFTYPSLDSLRSSFDHIHSSVMKSRPNVIPPTDAVVDRALNASLGLHMNEAEEAFTLSIVRNSFDYTSEDYVSDIATSRRKQIQSKNLVDLPKPLKGGFSMIGGMDDAKRKVTRDLRGLTKKAQAFGVDKPTGALMCGAAGGGKSYFVAAMGGEFGLDIVGVNAAKVLDCHLGKSEENLGEIFTIPKNFGSAGCILYVPEAEKFFGSHGNADDSTSGTCLRMMGMWLEYLQERKFDHLDYAYCVFVFNDGRTLSDALTRNGRFNTRIWVGLPNTIDREEIFRLHLSRVLSQRADVTPDDFPISEAVQLTQHYTPAEIETCCSLMLSEVYHYNEELELTGSDKPPLSIEEEGRVFLEVIKALSPQALQKNSDSTIQEEWAKDSGFIQDEDSVVNVDDIRGIMSDEPTMVKIGEKKLKTKKQNK